MLMKGEASLDENITDEQLTKPLHGCLVLDFSTLLPGPLATLLLAEAGADVVSIERPGYDQRPELLQLGHRKRRIVLDLKTPEDQERLRPFLERCDVLVEQFRPGVMRKLGLGYDDVARTNPRIVYCSITGYGQHGPRSSAAGHDVNYLADTGLLSRPPGASSHPGIPPVLIGDIAGGSYPAVINILLALRARERTGRGRHLDVSITDNLFTMAIGRSICSGNSPRYRLYSTRDGKMVAVGALEQKFWDSFCDAIQLDSPLRNDTADPAATTAAVAQIIGSESAESWASRLADRDCCCSIVREVSEAIRDPHFVRRGVTHDAFGLDRCNVPPLHVPIDRSLRIVDSEVAPRLESNNAVEPAQRLPPFPE